jgi:hypothetical protein
MARNDDAVLLPSTGAVLVGTVGSATQPTYAQLVAFAANTSSPPAGWTDLGHTSVDDLPAFGQEGGDVTTKGSWQSTALRTSTAAAVDYVDVTAIQIDNNILEMFYGGGTYAEADAFSLPDAPGTENRALTVVYFDGTNGWAFYAYKTSVSRADSPSFASDDFAKWPLRFTVLKATGQERGKWIGPGLGLTS